MRRLIVVATVALMVLVAGGAAADTFALRLVSQTNTTITVAWDPQPGYGYLFSSGGVLRSRTNDPSRTSVRFAKVSPPSYDVDVIAKGANGHYPGVTPPPPVATIKQTIVSGAVLSGVVNWRAVYDGNGDGVEDDPGSVRFLVDGIQVLSETNPPFGDTENFWNSTSVSNGSHAFRVDAVNSSGTQVATNTVNATVTNGTPPPPPGDTTCPLPAYPDAGCTGVPAGTTLTPSGSLTISTAGTVVNGLEITGNVVVNAANVTIRNTRIHSNGMWVIDNNSTGLVVEDSEIINRPVSGQNNCHNAIGDANFTVRRTEITGCENGMNVGAPGNITFTDNWIHDLDTTGPSYVFGSSPHTDGIQFPFGDASNIVIRHNTIDPVPGNSGATSAIIMTGENGPESSVWVEDNYIDGRGASTAIYAPRVQTHDVYINRNHMYKGVYGQYTFCVKLGVTVTEFNGNSDAGTGAAVSPDNGVGGGCTN